MSTTTVILGGGFGGITAANTLRELLPEEHDIVVVDASARFHVGAGKTWIMLGERTHDQISQSRVALLAPGIRFVESEVSGIALADRTVTLHEDMLRWDHLVIALGADLDATQVPGLAEAARTFYTVEGAQRLAPELAGFSQGDIAILIPRVPFKCPPAPYEAAMLLHHAFARRGLLGSVRLAMYTAEGAPMATAGPEMGQFIKGELAQRSIAYFPQKAASRVDGAAGLIQFEDGSSARYDLLIAIPPHVAPKAVRDAKLAGPSGWIPVDPLTLKIKQSQGVESVYAIGDVAGIPLPGRFKPDIGLSLPKAGVFAAAHGRVAAHQIAGHVLGRKPEAFFDGKGYCFLETGAGRAVKAEGSFFELPHPVMQKKTPDVAQLQDKREWIERLLVPRR